MYIIEMHYKHRAFSQVVTEKGDDIKAYNDFTNYKVIVNHSGDVDERYCSWCKLQQKRPVTGHKIHQ